MVYIDGRDVLQYVGDRSARRRDVLVHGEHFLVQFETHGRALSDYFHFVQRLSVFFELDTAEVDLFAGHCDLATLLTVTHERDDDRVRAVGYVDTETTRLIGNRSGDQTLALHHADVREVNRFLRAEVNHFTGHLCRKRAERKDQKRNYREYSPHKKS